MHAPAQPIIPSELLLLAYRNGIFPMSDSRDDPEVFWVEPTRRAILPLDGFRLSRSLAKTIRQECFHVTCNAAFDRVIARCAEPRPDHPESWISTRIMDSYRELHIQGRAHSIECWRPSSAGGDLVGGLYGVGFDGVFCGESMFSRADNASKVALAWLVALMRRSGARLLDCQFLTDHLASLGAVEIDQQRYVALLADAAGAGAGVGAAALPDAFGALEDEAAGLGVSPAKLILQSLTHTS